MATRPLLEAALGATRWLDAKAEAREVGLAWSNEPGVPSSSSAWLYQGSAGILPVYLEAYAVTGDPRLLAQACAGAEALVGAIDYAASTEAVLPPGLYEGVAGLGFVLWETYRASGRDDLREAAEACLDAILESADIDADGAAWADEAQGADGTSETFAPHDIMAGAAGIGLFLLYAEREMRPGNLELALAAGRRLVASAEPGSGGSEWRTGNPRHPSIMPNFSHGAAGIGYFLARLHRATGDRQTLEAALAVARGFQARAAGLPDVCLVPHFVPRREGTPEFALGWCHGPFGTAALWRELHLATGEEEWMDWFRRSVRAHLPGKGPAALGPLNTFRDSAGWCHGSAGNAAFLLWAHRVAGDAEFKSEAERLLEACLAASKEEAGGRAWDEEGVRLDPASGVRHVEFFPQAGLAAGAAGIGYGLLLADAFLGGRTPRVVLPDFPYADPPGDNPAAPSLSAAD